MKKAIVLIIVLSMLILTLSSCLNDQVDSMPEDTDLEYWLLDYIDRSGMTNIEHLYSRELNAKSRYEVKWYLSDKYSYQIDENGDKTAPDEAVVYRLERFPVAELGILRVTGIEITDPNVYFCGLNVNSTYNEIVDLMQQHGYAYVRTAEVFKGKYVMFDSADNSITVTFYYEKGIIEIEYNHNFRLAYLGLLFGD
ncbi:MAG: hypothetical protein IKM40_00560 [Clostridia bacterium]|nr:hypothetical protein [Clostridia bacterium]